MLYVVSFNSRHKNLPVYYELLSVGFVRGALVWGLMSGGGGLMSNTLWTTWPNQE